MASHPINAPVDIRPWFPRILARITHVAGAHWPMIALIALAVFAAATRLPRLDANPPWYTDECIYADVARNLAGGEARFGALNFPFGRESLAKGPVWFLWAAPFQWLPGSTMLKARLASALCALLLIGPIYGIGRRLHSREAGLLAVYVSLVHGPALLYFRWASPYALGGLLNALSVWFLVRGEGAGGAGQRERRAVDFEMAAAGLCAGLAAATDFFSVQTMVLVYIVCALKRRWRGLAAAIAASLLPATLFVAWGCSIRGAVFLSELTSLFFQFSDDANRMGFFSQMAFAARVTLFRDPIYALGIVGLAFWGIKKKGGIPAAFLLFMLPLILRRQGIDTEAPHNLPSYIFAIHLGFGVLLWEIASWVGQRLSRRCIPAAAAWTTALLIAAPMGAMTAQTFHDVFTTIPIGAKSRGSIRNMNDAQEAARYINAFCDPSDLAIVPDRLLPAVDCMAASIGQALFAEGDKDNHWYRYVTPQEFAFQPLVSRARVIVIDTWEQGNMIDLENPKSSHPFVRRIQERRWVVAHVGEYVILSTKRNVAIPSHSPSPPKGQAK